MLEQLSTKCEFTQHKVEAVMAYEGRLMGHRVIIDYKPLETANASQPSSTNREQAQVNIVERKKEQLQEHNENDHRSVASELADLVILDVQRFRDTHFDTQQMRKKLADRYERELREELHMAWKMASKEAAAVQAETPYVVKPTGQRFKTLEEAQKYVADTWLNPMIRRFSSLTPKCRRKFLAYHAVYQINQTIQDGQRFHTPLRKLAIPMDGWYEAVFDALNAIAKRRMRCVSVITLPELMDQLRNHSHYIGVVMSSQVCMDAWLIIASYCFMPTQQACTDVLSQMRRDLVVKQVDEAFQYHF